MYTTPEADLVLLREKLNAPSFPGAHLADETRSNRREEGIAQLNYLNGIETPSYGRHIAG